MKSIELHEYLSIDYEETPYLGELALRLHILPNKWNFFSFMNQYTVLMVSEHLVDNLIKNPSEQTLMALIPGIERNTFLFKELGTHVVWPEAYFVEMSAIEDFENKIMGIGEFSTYMSARSYADTQFEEIVSGKTRLIYYGGQRSNMVLNSKLEPISFCPQILSGAANLNMVSQLSISHIFFESFDFNPIKNFDFKKENYCIYMQVFPKYLTKIMRLAMSYWSINQGATPLQVLTAMSIIQNIHQGYAPKELLSAIDPKINITLANGLFLQGELERSLQGKSGGVLVKV